VANASLDPSSAPDLGLVHEPLTSVFADGVRSNMESANMPGADRYPAVPKGEPMAGSGYPLLFDPVGGSFQPEFADGDWQRIRDEIYRGRGT